MSEKCNHESETRITLTPASIEYEFKCKKCGAKKYKSTPIVPFWLADTGRPSFRRNFKPYKPKDEKKKHWWQR